MRFSLCQPLWQETRHQTDEWFYYKKKKPKEESVTVWLQENEENNIYSAYMEHLISGSTPADEKKKSL